MKMARDGNKRSGTRVRRLSGAATRWIHGSLVAWVAIVALVFQLGSASPQREMAGSGQSDALAALGVLSALLGPNVALCLHEEDSAPGLPSHGPHHCCVDCVVCQSGSHASVLAADWRDAAMPIARIVRSHGFPEGRSAAKPRSEMVAQPRAPPVLV
jgi:hypothetical protein